MKKNIVFPGDRLASAEELLPGEGTYANGEHICAAIFGEFETDQKKRCASIKPFTVLPTKIKEGDEVIVKAREVSPERAFLKIICKVEEPERSIPHETDAVLRISQISNQYTTDVTKEYHPNDIIRAKVISDPPSLHLSTKGKEFGVIKAYCTRCRRPLKKRNNTLYCDECKRPEMRKMASDYGEGRLTSK